MKKLLIENGEPKYLSTSSFGSYYIDVDSAEKVNGGYLVKDKGIQIDEFIPDDDAEILTIHYPYYYGDNKNIKIFLERVINGEIDIERAVDIISNKGREVICEKDK